MEPIPETRQVLEELTAEGATDLVAVVASMGRVARRVVPQCVGLSLALLEEDLAFTLVATDEDIAALDAVQYLDGGPCVDAAHRREMVSVDHADMTDGDRWQLFARTTAARGIASTLTLPIVRQGRVIGSVNLYASTPDAFVGHEGQLADGLGASAEDAVTNADLSFATRLAAAAAPERLADQTDVDIAIGLIAVSQQVDVDTAHQRLKQAAARAGITEGQAARAFRGILA